MKETTLWNRMRPLLADYGKFQKISDRFSMGVSDILGTSNGSGFAIELKEFYLKGGFIRTKFRPGQVPFLEAWTVDGFAVVVGTYGRKIFAIEAGQLRYLEKGVKSLSEISSIEREIRQLPDFLEMLIFRGRKICLRMSKEREENPLSASTVISRRGGTITG